MSFAIDTLVRLAAEAFAALRKRPSQWQMNPVGETIREKKTQGLGLLRRIAHAEPGDKRALDRLAEEIISWYGDFEVALNEHMPEVFQTYRSPGIPTPITLDVLRETVKANLATLSQIERRLFWPVPLFRLQRRFSRK